MLRRQCGTNRRGRDAVVPSWLHSLVGWALSGRGRPYSQFGSFAAVLGAAGAPAPLLLLSMRSAEANTVIDRIERALSAADSPRHVDAMLAGADWRPHLVAAVALILDAGRRLDPSPLWAAVDAGSWVTPQLVATAYLIDPSFPDRLRTRIDRKCAVVIPPLPSAVERHRATGPATPEQRAAKLLAALVRIGMLTPGLAEWLRAAAGRSDLMVLQAADRDSSGNIAENWLKNVQSRLRARGHALAPAGRRR